MFSTSLDICCHSFMTNNKLILATKSLRRYLHSGAFTRGVTLTLLVTFSHLTQYPLSLPSDSRGIMILSTRADHDEQSKETTNIIHS